MGYTVWHDVAAAGRGADPDAKIDHIVLGPSGLYGILSEDFGGPVRVRRGELVGDGVVGRADRGAGRADARRWRARRASASAARSSCCPTTTCSTRSPSSARCAARPWSVVSRSALSTVLRRGITGAREIGGNEVFDVRTRLQQAVRFA